MKKERHGRKVCVIWGLKCYQVLLDLILIKIILTQIVSQFTLFANVHKGNKPDFHKSMKADQSREMYAAFVERLKQEYSPDKIKGTPPSSLPDHLMIT